MRTGMSKRSNSGVVLRYITVSLPVACSISKRCRASVISADGTMR
jgi:hypothetical protein